MFLWHADRLTHIYHTIFCSYWCRTLQVHRSCCCSCRSSCSVGHNHFHLNHPAPYLNVIKVLPYWNTLCVCNCMHVCVTVCCTCRAEASIDTVVVTGVAGLWVGAGISTGTPTLLVLHFVGTWLPCEYTSCFLTYVTSLIIFIHTNFSIVAWFQPLNGLPTVQKYPLLPQNS